MVYPKNSLRFEKKNSLVLDRWMHFSTKVAIASSARATDFTANWRSMDQLITHASKVKFKTDTMTAIIVLQSNYFNINI